MNMDSIGIVKRETIPRTPDGVRIPSRPSIPTEPGRPNGLPALPGSQWFGGTSWAGRGKRDVNINDKKQKCILKGRDKHND